MIQIIILDKEIEKSFYIGEIKLGKRNLRKI
jgi:hypothetical protein